jgi:acyl-CoA reductase-like NAD-dependent aldehyde dehydrogenase
MTTITSSPSLGITANIWPNIINGRDISGGGEEVLRDSPAHDVRVASYHSASEADVDAAVMAADRAFSVRGWPQTSGAERAALLRRVAARIEAELDELALI